VKPIVSLGVLLVLAVVAPAALAAQTLTMVIEVDGKPVESEIVVLQGLPESTTAERADEPSATAGDPSTGMATGHRTHAPVIFRKRLDKSSPLIAKAFRTGRPIPELTLRARTSSSPYLLWHLEQVRVTSYSVTGATDGGAIPTESISMTSLEVEWQ
jgi:type VI protein secretion system component Hcp